jgi:TonB family protein
MEITRAEENKNRIISAIISSAIFLLLIFLLIWLKLVRPNPPFPESGGGGGQELALGLMNVGNSDLDYGKMGTVSDVVTESTPASAKNDKEEVLTDPNGESVKMDEAKNEKKNPVTVVKPVKNPVEKPREKTAAEKLAEKYKKNSGKDGGGIGNNDVAGQNGSPDGDPFKDGNGGHGNGDGGGTGDGSGPGSGPGKGPGSGYSINLKGRAVLVRPKLPSDTKEEGKVVVEITVDSEGKVIDANPNGRGTTTSSATLKAKAVEVARSTKFNVDGRFEEQRGTITIVFAFE